MKVLLIGGTGRLSMDTTKLCLALGYDVYLINRGNRNIIEASNLHYLIGDINDNNSASKALGGEKFDVVIDYLTYTLDSLKKRIDLIKDRTKQYVFISSATVFKPQEEIISENTSIGNDGWSYAKQKLICEKYLETNKAEWPFEYTIVRPYITYDNRRIPFPVISKNSSWNIVYRIEKGLPIVVPGDGNQAVTVTSTKDFAKGIVGLLLNEKAYGNDFNITGDTISSWNEILHAVEMAVGKSAKVVYVDPTLLAVSIPTLSEELLFDKAYSHVFDNSKIKGIVTEFITTVDIVSGMKETVEYLQSSKKEQVVDLYWNSMVNVVCAEYGKGLYKCSLKDRYRYLKAQSPLIRKLRSLIKR